MTRLPLPAGLHALLTVRDGVATIVVMDGRRECERHVLPWTVAAVRASPDSQVRHIAELARLRGVGPVG